MAIEIGSLVVEMSANVARLSQDMDKVRGTVDRTMAGVQRAASVATTALGLIGVGVSVAGLVNIVRSTTDAIASLKDFTDIAGISAEKASALAEAAKIGGHELGMVQDVAIKLNKALNEGGEAGKKAEGALAALGLKAAELRKMDTADAMLAVAKALDQYADGGQKAQVMIDLLGRSGAQAIPFMNDLAEAGELVATVTTEQVDAADRYQKNLNAVSAEADALSRALTAKMLPVMADITTAMREAAKESGVLTAAWVGFGGIGAQVLNPIIALFKQLGASSKESVADFNEFMARFTTGDTKQNFLKTAIQARAEAKRIYEEMAAMQPGGSVSSPAAKVDKPTLNYTPAASASAGGKSGGNSGGVAADPDAWFSGDMRKALEAETRATEKARAEIERLRSQYVALADPLQKYRVQLDEINKLRADGVLTADQALAAEWAVNEAMDAQIGKLDEVKDKGKETFDELGRAIDGWGKSAASAFVDFATGGKASFSDLIIHMAKEAATMMAYESIFKPLFGGLGDWVKSAIPKFALGGDHAGGYRIVGEDGPELEATGAARYFNAAQTRAMMGGGDGGAPELITPNDKIGGRSVTVINNFTISQPTDRRTQEQIATMAGVSIQQAMARGA